jgi:HK97 gp10 family phage protein
MAIPKQDNIMIYNASDMDTSTGGLGHPDITATLTGIQEIDDMFHKLSEELKVKFLRESMKESLDPIKKEVKEDTPVASGGLKKALTTRTKINTFTGFISGTVMYRRKKAPHAHLIEWGTVNREVKNWLGRSKTGLFGQRMKVGKTKKTLNVTGKFKKHRRAVKPKFQGMLNSMIASAALKAGWSPQPLD